MGDEGGGAPEHRGREGRGDQLYRGRGQEAGERGVQIGGRGGELRRRPRDDLSAIRIQTSVHMVRVKELILRAIEEPREPAAVHRGDANDEELLGEEGVEVVGGDNVEVDGELGVGPGLDLGEVEVRVPGVLGTRAKTSDD